LKNDWISQALIEPYKNEFWGEKSGGNENISTRNKTPILEY